PPAESGPVRACRPARPASPPPLLPKTTASSDPPTEPAASREPTTTWGHAFAQALWSGGAPSEPGVPRSGAADLARTWRALGEERNRLLAELARRGCWLSRPSGR